MRTKSSEPYAAVQDCQAKFIVTAERELSAFLAAIRQEFTAEAAYRAGEYWMDAFKRADFTCRQTLPDWRKITIAAASRMAIEGVLQNQSQLAAAI